MNARTTMLVPALLTAALTAQVIPADPARTGALGVPANDIVGLWSTQATVSGCATGVPVIQVRNTLLFHSGGTVTENFEPTSQRNLGLGRWSYDPATGRYTMQLGFDRFAAGVFVGHSTVERQLVMSADGLQMSGPVRATAYAVDGSVILELCGNAVSERLH